jgi:hypothetical protein
MALRSVPSWVLVSIFSTPFPAAVILPLSRESHHGTREYILLPGCCKNCIEAARDGDHREKKSGQGPVSGSSGKISGPGSPVQEPVLFTGME